MMERTQISLPREDHRRAKARAAELGISLAEYIRRLLKRDLGDPQRQADPLLIVNLGRADEPTDIARFKDEYVGDAVEAEWRRETGHE